MNQLTTVVIPTHHRPDMIQRAVESSLNQTIRTEVFVVDDNGKDSEYQKQTEEKLKEYLIQKRIQYLVNEKNSGGSFSRNQGLNAAHGVYITFLDDDDEIAPNKLEKQVQRLEQLGKDYSCCLCGYHKVSPSGKVYRNGENVEGNVYPYALARSIYNGSGSNLLVRTDIARAVGGYDVSFRRNQDLEFMARILKDYQMAFVPDDLFTIHYEDHKKADYALFVHLDEFWIQKFGKEIDALPAKQKEGVYSTIALERWRQSLSYGTREKKDGKAFLKKYHVSARMKMKYIFYLLDRVMNHRSCGFKAFPIEKQ